MIGSAMWSRSYGLTQGSILQPPTASPAAASASKRASSEVLDPLIDLLPEQCPDLGLILALVPRLVAQVYEAHRAVAPDNHGARHRLHLVELRDLILGIEQHRKSHRRFLEPLTRAFSVVLLDVYGEQLEAQAVVLLVERLQMRHLLPARHAPSRPEIHHDDLALQLCQRNLLTLVRLKREAGRRARHGR